LHDKASDFGSRQKHEEEAICIANLRILNVFRIAGAAQLRSNSLAY